MMLTLVSAAVVLALPAGWGGTSPGQAKGPARPAKDEAGQVTFVSRILGVALDHPSDWTVGEQASEASFTSPQGVTIRLAQIATVNSPDAVAGSDDASLERLPNVRCSSLTNAQGVEFRTCLDTISRSYSSDFTLGTGSAARRFSLSMARRLDLRIFNAMVASVRAAP
jgi:hypothetical protein